MGLVLQGFSNALWEVGRVGTFGAAKYGEFNWCYLDNAKSRYKDALFRHLFQYMQGKDLDDESGLKHLSHACWNCLALLEFELKGERGLTDLTAEDLDMLIQHCTTEIRQKEERNKKESEEENGNN